MKSWGLILLALALTLAMASCSQTNERNRNSIEVVSVAGNGIFVAGILDPGADNDACITADNETPAGHVTVVLHNRPANDFVTAQAGDPYGQFHITEVAVAWVDVHADDPFDAQTAFNVLQNFNYATGYDVAIPMAEDVAFNVLLVPFHMKVNDFFQGLLPPCARPAGLADTLPFAATALITLTGHDSGSEVDVDVEAHVIVEFIGLVDAE